MSRTEKSAFIIAPWHPSSLGGGQEVALATSNEFMERGHDTTWYYPKSCRLPRTRQLPPALHTTEIQNVVGVPILWNTPSVKSMLHLVLDAIQKKPKAIMFHDMSQEGYYLLLALLASGVSHRGTRISVVHHSPPVVPRFHEKTGGKKEAFKNSVLRADQHVRFRALKSSHVTSIAVSKYQEREVIESGLAHFATICYPPSSHEFFSTPGAKRKMSRTSRLNLLNVGRMTDQKDPHFLGKLAVELNRRNVNAKVRHVGPLYDSQYSRDVVNMYGEDIDFVGPKTGHDLVAEYENADMYLHTAAWETFGMVIIEAMIKGLPVITRDLPTAHEIFDAVGGKPGMISHGSFEEQIGQIADAIEHLVLYRHQLLLMSEDALRAATVFHPKKLTKEMVDVALGMHLRE